MVTGASAERESIVCLLICIRAPGHGIVVGDQFLLLQAERPNLQAYSSFHWHVIRVKGKVSFAGPWLYFMRWVFLTTEPVAWPGAVIQPMLKGSESKSGPKHKAWLLWRCDRRSQPSRGSMVC